jgi:hypothetical protein
MAPPSSGFPPDILACEFILILRVANYKRRPPSTARFSFDRVTSVAAMQELARISPKNCRVKPVRSSFDRALQHAGGSGFNECGFPNALKRALTGFKRLATCSMVPGSGG